MGTIGEVIKAERKKVKLTQRELAKQAKISNTFLCDIEKNRAKPSLPVFIRLLDALGVKKKSNFINKIYVNSEKADAI